MQLKLSLNISTNHPHEYLTFHEVILAIQNLGVWTGRSLAKGLKIIVTVFMI